MGRQLMYQLQHCRICQVPSYLVEQVEHVHTGNKVEYVGVASVACMERLACVKKSRRGQAVQFRANSLRQCWGLYLRWVWGWRRHS
mmetsp:Transcript_107481/g.181728  ORF Transcript_107481/g.181728 Transcript_107481/m.181728 type:complete len:86 (-) Transcript_107481:994-1251(-)